MIYNFSPKQVASAELYKGRWICPDIEYRERRSILGITLREAGFYDKKKKKTPPHPAVLAIIDRYGTVVERSHVRVTLISGEVIFILIPLIILSSDIFYFDDVESVETYQELDRVYQGLCRDCGLIKTDSFKPGLELIVNP